MNTTHPHLKPGRSLLWRGILSLLCALPCLAPAQTPLDDMVFSVGTTWQDGAANNWAYLLIGSPQDALLAGKRFNIYSKPGYSTNAGTFTLRSTIAQQANTTAIDAFLAQGAVLGDDLLSLSNGLNLLLRKIPGITNQPLPQKVLTAFQTAPLDPSIAESVHLIGPGHPGFLLAQGRAFAEQISSVTTYEIRELSPATGTADTVVGRVTVTPGAPVILPAPGPAFQVVTNDPLDHLHIRLRWGTPDPLRRLSLLNNGFNVWRIPKADALAAGYNVNPPSIALIHTPAFTKANRSPVTASKDFAIGAGPGGAADASDRFTYFFNDSNGRNSGGPGFADKDEFYYFITARDILGRDGLVSLGGLGRACRRIPPLAPHDLTVQNTVVSGQQALQLAWHQNTNTADQVAEYWVYRWPNPSMVFTNEATPITNRIGVVPHLPGVDLNSFVDSGADAPVAPGVSNYWYTVRAVSTSSCDPLFSPHLGPAWGVLREFTGPDATTGDLIGSCGTPSVIFQNLTVTSDPAGTVSNSWNYRLTCTRRDPGISWVQFVVTNINSGLYTSETIGPIYFPPDDNVVSADYIQAPDLNVSRFDVVCFVGSVYGLQSRTSSVVQMPAQLPAGQRIETTFLAGQVLETAMSASDPLLPGLGAPSIIYRPANNVRPDPSGTVAMSFDVTPGTPILVQAYENSAWVDLGVYTGDANNTFYVAYPACLIGPLPPFRGGIVGLPAFQPCPHHLARAAGDGPLAPVRVRFRLTPRTREYRLYRSVDSGPLTMISQGRAVYDSANSGKLVVKTDNTMPPGSATLCYFVQLLDEHGNGSPMALLACIQVSPPNLPTPTLGEPQSAGTPGSPQVTLNWFCPTSGVYRFQLGIARTDKPASTSRTGFASLLLTRVALNIKAVYTGLVKGRKVTVNFSEGHFTPPIGPTFGPGPGFAFTANVLPNVPYRISVAAMDSLSHTGHFSTSWEFIWKPPVVLPTVPWPTRNPPAVRATFDDDDSWCNAYPWFCPRVAALTGNTYGQKTLLDAQYPVLIRVGIPVVNTQFLAAFNSNVGTNAPFYFSYVYNSDQPPDPNTFFFKRLSNDPGRRNDSIAPFVVYRQQVTNSTFSRVSGNLTQVTPLIEKIPFTLSTNANFQVTVTVPDRLFAYTFEHACSECWSAGIYVRDQQPVIAGASYQYYLVRFNAQHEVAEIISAGQATIPLQ